MTVDFTWKKVPALHVASIVRKGPWNENILRPEFRQLVKWARSNKLRDGRWIFRFGPDERRWEACLEIRGKAKPEKPIRLRVLPAATVASVTFDPEEISPRVIYHGLNDWLKWRKKDGEIKSVGASREVYPGDPWTDKRAAAHTEIQFTVRKK